MNFHFQGIKTKQESEVENNSINAMNNINWSTNGENFNPWSDDAINWPTPIPLFKQIRGLIFALICQCMAIFLMPYAAIPFFWIGYISRKFWNHYVLFWIYTWTLWYLFYLEFICGTQIIISGDTIPKGESVLVLSNHPSEADWLYVWSIADRYDSLEHVCLALKNTLQFIPGVSWVMDYLGFFVFTSCFQKRRSSDKISNEQT